MKEIILASNSPRRKKLLAENNIPFTVVASRAVERKEDEMRPEEMAMALAFEKAYEVAVRFQSRTVLGADTVVAVGNRILGKPKDLREAEEYLRLLSGNYHRVVTGFAILNLAIGWKRIDYEESFVYFRKIGEKELFRYVRSEEPYDKAGGYGIQGKASSFVEKYTGNYDNIVGLPVQKVFEYLRELEVILCQKSTMSSLQ